MLAHFCRFFARTLLTFLPVATDIKEQIEKYKQEKLGGRRKDFVETVKTETAGNADGEAMVLD